jgi:hypothetical protein
MGTHKHHCSKCGAVLPPRPQGVQAKCRQCGKLREQPTYWGSLTDDEKVYAVFIMIGLGCVAVAVGFLLLVKALGWALVNLLTMY